MEKSKLNRDHLDQHEIKSRLLRAQVEVQLRFSRDQIKIESTSIKGQVQVEVKSRYSQDEARFTRKPRGGKINVKA